MSNIDSAEVQEFIIEATELIESAETELLNAERGPSTTFYDAVFRAFHSVKGGAGMLGLDALQAHMHKIESLWGQLKGRTQVSKPESEYFLAAIDVCRKLLSGQTASFDYDSLTRSSSSQTTSAPVTPPPTTPTEEKSAPPTQSSPPQEVKVSTPTKKSSETKTKRRGLIYAVDDEQDILDVIRDVLSEDGFEVSCFSQPKDYIAKIREQVPDVVITDFKMPQMSGLDILHQTRSTAREVPVIMLSGFVTKEILIESMVDGGFYGVLEKPFKPMDLLRECWSAFRHHELQRLTKKSLNLLLYQFSDLEKYLIAQNKVDIAKTMNREIKDLLSRHKQLGITKRDAK